MYDLSILKAFLNKEVYLKYRNFLKKEDFLQDLHPILNAVDGWYKSNENHPTAEDIANYTFAQGIPEKQRDYVKEILYTFGKTPVPESVEVALERFREQVTLERIAAAADAGDLRGVKRLVEDLNQNADQSSGLSLVTDDIDDILDSTVLTPGLRWRLDSLNKSLGSLRKGDFGFFFKRPETGGTTFLADQTAYFASQLKESDGPILWLNNEEQGKKVRLRSYEATLGARVDQLIKARERAKEAYQKATKGKLFIFDSPVFTKQEVEALCRKFKPSLLAVDQLSKTKGFDNDRPDLELGSICQWYREIAKTYCPVIGIHQADGTAEGIDWLNMGHVANAKTAMQAEADFLVGIGKRNEKGYEEIRYFNVCKNKLVGDTDTDPKKRHAQIETRLRADIARYEDL